MRAGLIVTSLLAATVSAHANGRPPATSSIQFRVDHEEDILLGMTFGVVLSRDGGVTWQWMCERAIGYGGVYDPRFLWFPSGSIFATTQKGLHVSHDGCTFEPSVLGDKFVSAIARGSDNALYVAVSDPKDSKIYKSTDEGVTFSQSAAPATGANTWWQMIAVTPSDPDRVYLSGGQYTPRRPRTHLFRRSTDGGRSFTELPVSGFTPISDNSTIEVVAISPTNPDLFFVRVSNQTGEMGDAIYRSTDGGQSFAKVLEVADSLTGFVLRKNGEILVDAPTRGMFRSTDGGLTFNPMVTAPALHGHCLVESASGTLWRCTDNFAADRMGVARSTDGATWSKAFRYQELAQPVACAGGTPQATCAATDWCLVRTQLGITANPTDCPPIPVASKQDKRPTKHAKGCCDAGQGPSSLAIAALAGIALIRRRASAR